MVRLNIKYLKSEVIRYYSKYLKPSNTAKMASIKEMFSCDIGIGERQIDRLLNQGIYSAQTLQKCIEILNLDLEKLFIKEM